MHVTSVEGTDLFTGTQKHPLQVVRIGLHADAADLGRLVSVVGEGVTTPAPAPVTATGDHVVEVSVETTVRPGSTLAVSVRVDGVPLDDPAADAAVEVAEPGWTMHMVSHFHYDPVWWNTQAAYTSEWDALDFEDSPRIAFQQSGFTLVRAHLELARQDPDYCFVLAEVDYLKPYWDLYPQDRAFLRQLMDEERLELMGGTWNEPNTNLTGAELTIRNAVYGIGFQRDVLGGDPQTAWQLDVFGHDPQFPGIMADAGLTSSSWARGPFHQWGPMLTGPGGEAGDATVMQFPAEFEWISPSGRGLLTAYMANHYSSGWDMDSAPTLEDAMAAAYKVFSGLKPVAATKNVLLPVGTDYTPPNRWVTRVHREWNERYVWPRFVCALPRHFFAAVRSELAARGIEPSPQSRDMNPIYTGKDVSYIDTKQAQREAEVTLQDAEKWATLASLFGAAYPDDLLDKAWRQLIYGAHHDGITGSESDQVYLDLLAGWRETRDLAHEVLDDATAVLAGLVHVDGEGWAVTVFNPLSWQRSEVVEVRCHLEGEATVGLRLHTLDGADVPFVVESATRGDGDALCAVTLRFLAIDLPSFGHRTWLLVPADDLPEGCNWTPAVGLTVSNDTYRVTADPTRGGSLSELVELASGRNLLADHAVGNELVVHEEYPDHPDFKEGPWHLVPNGTSQGSATTSATVARETSCLGERLVATGEVGPAAYRQATTLWRGVDRVDFTTWVDRWTGSDQLLRVRFPLPVEGALPVCEVANAVIGRGFGFPDVDSAQAPWTLDNPAHTWFGLSATATVHVTDGAGGASEGARRALGVADVVVPTEDQGAALARDLVVALAQAGVTATTSSAGGPRYGLLDVDSNLPDFRVAIGGPEENAFTAAVLAGAGGGYGAHVTAALEETGRARVWVPAATPLADVWVPNADLRRPGALPVLVVAGRTPQALAAELAAVAEDLADACIEVNQPARLHPTDGFDPRSVALLNRGLPGFVIDTHGTLHLSLMRSCTGWPSGVWIDPPARTVPDGSSFQLQHWTHRFDYALVSGSGDWRETDLVRHGQGYNHVPATVTHRATGNQPADRSFLTIEPETVALSALKATGNPLSNGGLDGSRPTERLTIRVYETAGRAVQARIRGFVPLGDATRSDLLESRLESLDTPDDAVQLDLDGSAIVTVTAHPDTSELTPAAPPALQPGTRPVEYARYWLHNRGVAPTGAHPVTVHAEGPTRVDGATAFRVTVASDLTKDGATGDVDLGLPDGWRCEPTTVSYDVTPGGHVTHDVVLTPPGGATGSHLLRFGLTDPSGTRTEDVLTVLCGDGVVGSMMSAELMDTELTAAPGTTGRLTVALTNHAHGALDAEVQVLTPYGIWDATPTWTTRARVEGPGTDTLALEVAVPHDAAPGSYWALVKVMGAGGIVYSPAIPFVVRPSGEGSR